MLEKKCWRTDVECNIAIHDEPNGSADPARVLEKAYTSITTKGFSIACIVPLTNKNCGMEIIARELQQDEGHQDVLRLYLVVYKNFTEAVNAEDNGIKKYNIDQPPKYVSDTSLPLRVKRFNLDWMDPDQLPENENVAFEKQCILLELNFSELLIPLIATISSYTVLQKYISDQLQHI